MNKLAEKYLRPSQIPTKACHGCGIGMIENWLLQAIDELGLKQEDVIFGTGIGCVGPPDVRHLGRRQLRRHARPRAGRGHRPEAGPAGQEVPDRRRRRRCRVHRHLAPDPRRAPQPGRDGDLRGQHGLRVDGRPVLAHHAGGLRHQLEPVRHGGARLRSLRRRQGRRRHLRGGDDGDAVAPDGEDRQEGARRTTASRSSTCASRATRTSAPTRSARATR